VAVIALWVISSPEVQSTIGTPSEIEELVNHDFAAYYGEHSAAAFGLHVWVNNSWVAAKCIAFSVLLGVPIPFVLFANAANLGVVAGLMLQAGKGDVMLGLLLPHGLLELTAVLLAGATGMRLGWSVISPGDRPRGQVLAEQGRAVVSVAVGLVVVLLVSGAIEALVTPSPRRAFWPTSGTSAAAQFGRVTPGTSPRHPMWSQRGELKPASGFHRQITVCQCGRKLTGRCVDDLHSAVA
jgi:uncharacterized membrane protein SpoIIM required for sporulation